MKNNEKFFPSISIGNSSAKTVVVKSKSNIKNNRVLNISGEDFDNSDEDGLFVVVVKSKSNIKNNRTLNSKDIDVTVYDNDAQSVVVVKSKSNIKNN